MLNKNAFYLCGTDEYGTTLKLKHVRKNYHVKIYVINTINYIKMYMIGLILNLMYSVEQREIDQMYCKICNLFLADRYFQGYCYSKKCRNLKNIANGDQFHFYLNNIGVPYAIQNQKKIKLNIIFEVILF